jgi:hypothetical protein
MALGHASASRKDQAWLRDHRVLLEGCGRLDAFAMFVPPCLRCSHLRHEDMLHENHALQTQPDDSHTPGTAPLIWIYGMDPSRHTNLGSGAK